MWRHYLWFTWLSAWSRAVTDSYDPLKAMTKTENWFSRIEHRRSAMPSWALAFSVWLRCVSVCVWVCAFQKCINIPLCVSEMVNVKGVYWCESWFCSAVRPCLGQIPKTPRCGCALSQNHSSMSLSWFVAFVPCLVPVLFWSFNILSFCALPPVFTSCVSPDFLLMFLVLSWV